MLAALLVLTGACSAVPGESSPANRVSSDAVPKRFGTKQPGRQWRTSGYEPMPLSRRHYEDLWLTDHALPGEVDDDGIRLYERDGQQHYHPVAIAQYALAKLDVANRTGDQEAMDAASVNAAKLVAVARTHRGGLYFPYTFDFPLGGRNNEVLHAPWWSAMAQGQALSLFVGLYSATDDPAWREAADKTFKTLDDIGPQPGPWSVFVNRDDYLWFEEYAGDTKALRVLNGHIFAIFGIWDYYELTQSPKAVQLFDAGTTTLRQYLPKFRKQGEVSYYCLRAPFCQQPRWQNEKYHGIVIEQMRIVADMTDDDWFLRQADKFVGDQRPS